MRLPTWSPGCADEAPEKEISMPPSDRILSELARIANDASTVAIAWHLVLLVALIGLGAGWRPSKRFAGLLLTLPLLSSAVMAALYGNPFNAGVMGLVSAVLMLRAARLPNTQVTASPRALLGVGAALVTFGWVYPHFLRTDSAWQYVVAAPVGLVPCPSLAIAIGLAIAGRGLGDRQWSLTLALAGLFYGLFGSFRLGVWLDLALAAGAGVLIWVGFHHSKSHPSRKAHTLPRSHGRFRGFGMLAAAVALHACDNDPDGSDLPEGWSGATPVPLTQSACDGDPYTSPPHPRLEFGAGSSSLTGVYKEAQFRCGDQKLCGYALDTALTAKILIQPCEMRPIAVARCDCLYQVTFSLEPRIGRSQVELWSRRDLYGATGAVNATLIGQQPVP
jgi:hypothetical protein